MAKRMDVLKKDTCYHGNAGIASAFAALAPQEDQARRRTGLVLPLSVASGLAWQGLREMTDREYTDIEVLSIAANDGTCLFLGHGNGGMPGGCRKLYRMKRPKHWRASRR